MRFYPRFLKHSYSFKTFSPREMNKNLSTTLKIITYLRISPRLLVYYFCIYSKMELDNDAKMFISLNLSQLKASGITKTMLIDLTGVEIMSKKQVCKAYEIKYLSIYVILHLWGISRASMTYFCIEQWTYASSFFNRK